MGFDNIQDKTPALHRCYSQLNHFISNFGRPGSTGKTSQEEDFERFTGSFESLGRLHTTWKHSLLIPS